MVTAKKSTNLNVEMPKTFKKRVTKFSRSGQAKPNTTLSHIASNRHNNNTNSNSNNNNNNRNRTMGNINVSKTTFNTFMRKTMSKTTTINNNNNNNNNKTPKRFMNICTTPANNLKTLQPRRSILMAKMRKRNAKILKSKIALQQKQKHNAHGHVQRGMTNNAAVVNSNKTTSTTLKKKKKTGMHVRRIRHDINNTNTNNNNTQTYAYTNAQRTTGGGSSAGFGSVGGFGRGYGGGGVGVGVGASGSKPLKNVRNCTTKTTTTRATTPAKTRTIKKKPKLRKKHVRTTTTTTNTHGRLRGGEDKHNKTVEKSPILYIIEDEKMNKRDKKMHTKEAAKRLKYSMLQAKAASIEKRYGSLAAADIRKTNRKLQKGKTTKKLQLKGFLQTKSKAKSSKLHFFYNMGQKQQQQQLQQQQLQLQQQQRKQHLAGKRLTNQKRKPKKKAKLPQKRDAFKCINDIEVPLTAHVPILDITTAMGVDGVGGGGGVGISNAGGGQQYFNQYLQNRDQQLRKLLKQQNKI